MYDNVLMKDIDYTFYHQQIFAISLTKFQLKSAFDSFYPLRNNIFFLCAAIICLFLNGIAFTSFLMAD